MRVAAAVGRATLPPPNLPFVTLQGSKETYLSSHNRKNATYLTVGFNWLYNSVLLCNQVQCCALITDIDECANQFICQIGRCFNTYGGYYCVNDESISKYCHMSLSLTHSHLTLCIQEAQLPQRNSASAVHVYLGWLTDRAMHRTPRNRRGCTISDIQTF